MENHFHQVQHLGLKHKLRWWPSATFSKLHRNWLRYQTSENTISLAVLDSVFLGLEINSCHGQNVRSVTHHICTTLSANTLTGYTN